MKQLIVTADDFGYSRNVNKAIIKCFKEGIVTSTSLLANTKYFNESVKLLKQNRNIDVGVHINLTEFRPLMKAKTLADKNGNFIGKREWFRGFYKKTSKKEIENEINAQVKKAVSTGLKITHINGHNHIHIFPNVIDAAIKLAKKYKIKYIRKPDEEFIVKSQRLSSEIRKRNTLSKFSKQAIGKIIKNGLKTAGAFYGILDMNGMDFDKLSNIVKSLKNGTSELMVHPAYIDGNEDIFHQSRQRENEIKLLADKKIIRAIKKLKINLTNFSQL